IRFTKAVPAARHQFRAPASACPSCANACRRTVGALPLQLLRAAAPVFRSHCPTKGMTAMRIVEMATKLPPWPAARNRRNRVRLMLNPGARRPHAPGRQLFHCQAGNRLALLLLVLTCVAYSGCTYMPLEPHTAVQRDMLQTEALLLYSQSLLQADSPRRMAMLNIARAAYERNPLPMNVARLALAYGQPGYKGYAPENGWRYADKALTHDNADWAPTAAAYLRQFAML